MRHLYSIARAHSAGPGNVGPKALGDVGPKLFGWLWTVFWGCPGEGSFLTPGGLLEAQIEAWRSLGGLLEASWRLLGALKDAWSAQGGLPGAYGLLLEAS